ncbi:hypothetical protein AAG906_013202 [Vitis piasezkii]
MWKVCYPTVYLWSGGVFVVGSFACSWFSCFSCYACETRIAFTIHTFLAFFPFYLAKLGIAYQHWLIELQEVY